MIREDASNDRGTLESILNELKVLLVEYDDTDKLMCLEDKPKQKLKKYKMTKKKRITFDKLLRAQLLHNFTNIIISSLLKISLIITGC